ncbi:hypothetical protein BGZ75_004519 [Mortierella antarctica]|nr:hypothetical protein BGZ75_004519 [Mortierella antarctica]
MIIPHSRRRQCMVIISLLSFLLLLSIPQSVSAQSPPVPQPGSGLDGTSKPGVLPTTTQDFHPSGVTSTATMVNNAATPLSYPPPPAMPATTTLPKAPQSILVVESTTYGKVLPAAGPADDHIGGHFWDQYSQISSDGSRSSAALLSLPKSSLVVHSCFCGLLAVIVLLNI